jgi:hypothetical protein
MRDDCIFQWVINQFFLFIYFIYLFIYFFLLINQLKPIGNKRDEIEQISDFGLKPVM